MMQCVTIVCYSVHFNNMALEPFSPTRGLCQGDPLSPYLFLLVADGLSKILKNEIYSGALKELHVSRHDPRISHLLFANETLMFMEVSADQATVVNNALRQYERCTDQLINPSKCSMMMGANCAQKDKNSVMQIFRVSNVTVEEKHLGLPTHQGRMCKNKFKPTKERLAKRMSNYAERLMSAGPKEVLIKSVAQATPTYVMGVFKLLATLCEEMEQIIRYF
jgi:hypothetical protein